MRSRLSTRGAAAGPPSVTGLALWLFTSSPPSWGSKSHPRINIHSAGSNGSGWSVPHGQKVLSAAARNGPRTQVKWVVPRSPTADPDSRHCVVRRRQNIPQTQASVDLTPTIHTGRSKPRQLSDGSHLFVPDTHPTNRGSWMRSLRTALRHGCIGSGSSTDLANDAGGCCRERRTRPVPARDGCAGK